MASNGYFACHSIESDLAVAIDEVCDRLAEGLHGVSPDLSFVFVSHEHASRFSELAPRLTVKSQSRVLLGCTGAAIAAGGQEMETGPVISLWSAVFPGAVIEPFQAEFTQTTDGVACQGLPQAGADAQDVRAAFVLGEPFSSAPQMMIDHFAAEFPGAPLFGGMASGADEANVNRLFLKSKTIPYGAVGVLVRGGPSIRSVVSQGCRPIGTPFVVTKSEGNVVHALGGVAPMEKLQELLPSLDDADQQLLQNGLHLGIVMNEYQESFARGDFLITNVLGAREEDGSLAIGNSIRVGQTVQFHVRDAATADEDLTALLAKHRASQTNPARAALLFSCNGRGTNLFQEPNHDAATIQREIGPLPLAGFFAQGELGPVGGKNYIHGFTASVAIFE